MGAYVPALVWLTSAFICNMIASKRNVEQTLFRTVVAVFLGPLAIPLFFLFSSAKTTAS